MPQFSTDENVSLEKGIDTTKAPIQTNLADINQVYELEKCIEWINGNNYKKVCLQFPDYLLRDSCQIASSLQKKLEQVVYIMGDSAYESCCVDYVTAQHVNADAIIHFGQRCFSTWTNIIPCLCIYDKGMIDIMRLFTLFKTKFEGDHENIDVILDTQYIHLQDKIVEIFKAHNGIKVHTVLNYFDTSDSTVVYIGQNNRKLLNFQLRCRAKELYYYDPEGNNSMIENYQENNVILKRRRYLAEKVKDSRTVGIIIGTVVIQNYIKAIDRIKRLLKLHHKNYYVISVGRPTVAKLANFPEMDIYVLICCSMSDVFDSRDFFKPMVTPYDVEIALNPQVNNLSFSYDLDMDYLNQEVDEKDINESDVSLLTGNIRCNETLKEDSDTNSKEIAVKDKGILALSEKSGAGFLATRTFQGLEQNLGQTEVALAKDGRKGIPQHYENELF